MSTRAGAKGGKKGRQSPPIVAKRRKESYDGGIPLRQPLHTDNSRFPPRPRGAAGAADSKKGVL
ncbi:hypothetical protein HMPREF0262_00581 [Clostridium sp. ATCC 29733]|nr:hypothetical protein HMPREF0262_00581 [Clostridium sp. ATCC 29733]